MKQITGPSLAFLDGRFVNVPGDTMTGPLIIDGFSASEIGLIIKLAISQAANGLEIKDSDGNVLSGVDERGVLFSHGGSHVNNLFLGGSSGNVDATGVDNLGLSPLALGAVTAGYRNTAIGVFSLAALTVGYENTSIGAFSGRLGAVNRIGCIFIGFGAGYRPTANNVLIIDNALRASTAEQTTNAILYGEMAAAPADQTLRINASLTTSQGRIQNTTRATTTYTILVTDDVIFANTDGGTWTVTLPAGVEGQTFKIINSGSSANNLTVAPDGSEHLIGANSNFTLTDGETLVITYNATDGWY